MIEKKSFSHITVKTARLAALSLFFIASPVLSATEIVESAAPIREALI
ncbi:MAG: hypothetical protein HOO97_09405, partial [Sideroxydans sp.]|nr:hypothetical protein [Sideroxydans sp.]